MKHAKEAAETLNRALQAANQQLGRVARIDALTGLWNRRHFDDTVIKEIAKADRYRLPMSLVLFDIDHFKSVNDTHGHLAGDRVLVELSQLAQRMTRTTDLLFRWGGEEFLLLLPNTGQDEACVLAEKLRKVFASHTIAGLGTVTASFGVAAYELEQPLDTWISRVDGALYDAKQGGRNLVKTAPVAE